MDAFILMQAVEAAALSNTESAASATGRAHDWRATAFTDRGRGRPPSPIFSTGMACHQRWQCVAGSWMVVPGAFVPCATRAGPLADARPLCPWEVRASPTGHPAATSNCTIQLEVGISLTNKNLLFDTGEPGGGGLIYTS